MSMLDRNNDIWPKLGCVRCERMVLVYSCNDGICTKCKLKEAEE